MSNGCFFDRVPSFGVIFVMLALLILGTDPFVAFVSYQVPRIVSGEAFSFSERADVPTFIVSRNYSIYGSSRGCASWV
jgi:hypothetical protein